MGQQERAFDQRLHAAEPIRDPHGTCPKAGTDGETFSDRSLADDTRADTAKRLYAERQRRLSYFSNRPMFTDASWDILLCLFIGGAEARPAFLGELSSAANCAPSTALRWLYVLAEEGLVNIVKHSEHLPEIGVALSTHGRATMSRYLSDVSTD